MSNTFDVFLSYASEDRPFVLSLYRLIEDRGLEAWFDVHEISWGDSIVQRVQDGLRGTPLVIAFISDSYLRKPWPLKEFHASMASQISGSTTILPVLLGISSVLAHSHFPFLADIRHISVDNYSSSSRAPDATLAAIISELQMVCSRRIGAAISAPSKLTALRGPICSACCETHYGFFRAVSDVEICHIYEKEVKRRSLSELSQFIRGFGGTDSKAPLATIRAVWNDANLYPDFFFALTDGSVLVLHNRSVHENYSSDGDHGYQGGLYRGGAPPNPIMITVAPQTGHILLGYESGELFVLKALTAKIGSGLRSFFAEGEHSLSMDEPITVLTCSFESVMLAASVGGTIKIWSRRDYSLLGRLDLHTRVCALAVSPWVPAAQFIAALASGEVVFGSMKGDLIKAFRFREGPISSLVCLPPPFHCLAFTAGSNVVIVDQETGSVLGRLPLPAPATTLHCARGWRLSRRGIVLTVGLEQGEVLVYQLGGGHGVFERQFGKQEST